MFVAQKGKQIAVVAFTDRKDNYGGSTDQSLRSKSSLLSLLGPTSCIAEVHELVNVLGLRGIK